MSKGCQRRGRGVSGAREISTDGFHLPDRSRRDGRRKTVDPCSVSKPNGKNEREGTQGRGAFKPLTPLTRQVPTQASKASKIQDLLTVRARGRRLGRTDGQGRVQTGLTDQHAETGDTDDASDQFTRTKNAPTKTKRPHHNQDIPMKNWFELDE